MNNIKYFLEKQNALYVICAALMLLWYKKITAPLDQMERLIFVAAIGIGMLSISFIIDRFSKLRPYSRDLTIACCCISICLTFFLLLPNPMKHIMLFPLGFIFGMAVILQFADQMRHFPYEYRCQSICFFFALSGFINTTTDLEELPFLRVSFPVGSSILSVIALSATVLIFIFGIKKKTENVWDKPEKKVSYSVVVIIAMITACITYIVFGMKDSAAYPDMLAIVSPTGYIRYIEIPLFILLGVVCDKLGRHVLLQISLYMTLLGSLGVLLRNNTLLLVFSEICSFLSIISISTFMCTILSDLSYTAKYPTLTVGFGIMPIMVGQIIAFPDDIFNNLGETALFIIGFIPSIFIIPLVFALMEKIRSVYSTGILQKNVDSQKEDIPEKYGLTKREAQIYSLIMESKTVPEMAQLLYLTESTVKNHITSILRKTGKKNRVQLISDFM